MFILRERFSMSAARALSCACTSSTHRRHTDHTIPDEMPETCACQAAMPVGRLSPPLSFRTQCIQGDDDCCQAPTPSRSGLLYVRNYGGAAARRSQAARWCCIPWCGSHDSLYPPCGYKGRRQQNGVSSPSRSQVWRNALASCAIDVATDTAPMRLLRPLHFCHRLSLMQNYYKKILNK